jgi:hypothetical protein
MLGSSLFSARAGRRARPALRLRLALRAAPGCCRPSTLYRSTASSPSKPARQTLCHHRRAADRRRHRRRGRIPRQQQLPARARHPHRQPRRKLRPPVADFMAKPAPARAFRHRRLPRRRRHRWPGARIREGLNALAELSHGCRRDHVRLRHLRPRPCACARWISLRRFVGRNDLAGGCYRLFTIFQKS